MATSAKKAVKAAPAPAPVEEVTEGGYEIGQRVRFEGYDADTKEDEQILTVGEIYEIINVTEADEATGDEGGNPVVAFPNPDFNPKKKEHPDTNPKMIDVEVFPHEVTVVDDEEEEAGEEEVEAEAAPAPVAAKKAAAKAAPAKTAAKTAAAPAKAGKAAAKAAPAKKVAAKKVAKVKEEKAPEVDPLEVDLDGEDPEVLALIEGNADLIEIAQALESEASTKEWQLGGILYHIKKDKSFLELEGGAAYAEKGGFEKFLQDYFHIEYRKAMYLIQIYVYWTLAGIENPAEQVAAIGWTKASKISKLLTVENMSAEQKDELVELAKNNSVSELSEVIKDQVQVGGTPGQPKVRITLKFRFLQDEGAGINAILVAAAEKFGLKDIGEALSKIVHEWVAENGGEVASVDKAPAQRAPAAKKLAAVPAGPKRVIAKAA